MNNTIAVAIVEFAMNNAVRTIARRDVVVAELCEEMDEQCAVEGYYRAIDAIEELEWVEWFVESENVTSIENMFDTVRECIDFLANHFGHEMADKVAAYR